MADREQRILHGWYDHGSMLRAIRTDDGVGVYIYHVGTAVRVDMSVEEFQLWASTTLAELALDERVRQEEE